MHVRKTTLVVLILLAARGLSGEPLAPLPPPPAGDARTAEVAVPAECPSQEVCDQPAGRGGQAWARAETLLWWMKGASLPPLFTTSPAGTPPSQAGVLNAPGTTVLFGDSGVGGDARIGGRWSAGYWFGDNRLWGVSGDALLLEGKAANFSASSGGDPILARPFLDATTGLQNAELIAFPGRLAGSATASASTSGLIGAGALVHGNLCCGCWGRLDLLAGYRFLRFSDRLAIDESLVSTAPPSAVNTIVPGTTTVLSDRFSARNVFNGFDTGLSGEFRRGPWALDWWAKVAIGATHRVDDIDGATTFTVPLAPPSVTSAGGLLALPGNIGHSSDQHVSVIPEFGVNLGYQVSSYLRAYAGYTFLYWPQVIRVGDLIDTTVNPNRLPGAATPGVGPLNPAPTGGHSDFWVQGINVGLELRY
jgi:hypothetical protein